MSGLKKVHLYKRSSNPSLWYKGISALLDRKEATKAA